MKIDNNTIVPVCGCFLKVPGAAMGITRPYLKPWDIAPIRAANEPAKPPKHKGEKTSPTFSLMTELTMAWSDAARAAAAEVRRLHGGARKQFSKMGKFNISANTSKSARQDMARKLRFYRKSGAPYSEATRYEVISGAAASTRLRNIARLARRK